MGHSWFARLCAIAVALSCGCAVDSIGFARSAAVCQETVTRDSRGDPRNSAGQIRYCWPGEALCFCDHDNDCYAMKGYVPCQPPTDAGIDAATDAPRDVAAESGIDAAFDAPRDVAFDASSDVATDVGADAPLDAPGDVATDTGIDATPDVPSDVPGDVADAALDARADAGSCPPEPTTADSLGQPRNAAGFIRYCWPGEAHCFCDSDSDCYAEAGYVACTRPIDAGVDAATDAPRDVVTDVPRDALDGGVDVVAPLDSGQDVSPDVLADAGTDVPRDTGPDVTVTDVPVTDVPAGGVWTASQPWPYPAVHSVLLPDGRVLFWSDDHDRNPYFWNPSSGAFTDTGFVRSELHCAGHAYLGDGRLLLTGGEPIGTEESHAGITETNLFDHRLDTFTAGPAMLDLRWYPTNTTLPNGEVLITGGSRADPSDSNPIPEVYSLSGTLRNLMGATRVLELYPLMFLAPNGMVFQAGPDSDTGYLDPAGNGRWIIVAAMSAIRRIGGSGVMYDNGKILILGGSPLEYEQPVATAEVIDLNAATPRWTNVAAMVRPRRDPNVSLLPDGTVLVVGGTSAIDGPYVYETELWSPVTQTFTHLAPVTVGRGYHSESLLLPDGRVLFVGGNSYDLHSNAQIFSPPYLFRGPRPTVTAAPTSVSYGSTFTVSTADPATVTAVHWIRLGATTHGFDQNQRINRLSFSRVTGGITITAPSDRRLCPPGHHLLFLLSDRGVPSIAPIIQIQ